MNLYWFCDEDGHDWDVYAAETEERAWQLAGNDTTALEPVEERPSPEEQVAAYTAYRRRMQLAAVTEMGSPHEGNVATIFPLEVYFAIHRHPGSKELGHKINL